MKLFNALQIVAAFVAWPLLVAYIDDATFRGAAAAFWAAIALYIVAFAAMVGCVFYCLCEGRK